MAKDFWGNLSERISTIGGVVSDTDLRTQKSVLVILSLSAIPIGIIWAIIEFVVGEPINALVTGAIAVLILINFAFFIILKNFYWFRFSQLVIFISFPIVLHFAVGGFTQSANLIWSLAAPLIALLSSRPREGTFWFIVFAIIVAVSGIVDPLLFPINNYSVAGSFFQFSLNIINVSLIVYLMLFYFVRRKNDAYALLDEEKKTSEKLLLNVLPKEIAPVLKSGKETIADRFDSASILFADIVDFSRLSVEMAPEEMVEMLNYVFSHFDSLVEKYDLEKIRTIGDNYMIASGVPRPRKDHAKAMANLALNMAEFIQKLPSENGSSIDFRIGINSGPVVAGVIGRHKFQYDIWGDAVNTASRMESQGVAGKIQVTAATHELIKEDFVFEQRGPVDIKGKGQMNTWFLLDSK
jgi:guanylate cyclase